MHGDDLEGSLFVRVRRPVLILYEYGDNAPYRDGTRGGGVMRRGRSLRSHQERVQVWRRHCALRPLFLGMHCLDVPRWGRHDGKFIRLMICMMIEAGEDALNHLMRTVRVDENHRIVQLQYLRCVWRSCGSSHRLPLATTERTRLGHGACDDDGRGRTVGAFSRRRGVAW